jgi:hypothetical protein
VRNSPVGAASALLGGGIMAGAVAYEPGFLSLDLALWCALLFAAHSRQVALAVVVRRVVSRLYPAFSRIVLRPLGQLTSAATNTTTLMVRISTSLVE